MAGNTFSVTMRDGDKLEKRLKKLKEGSETALKRTVSDFQSRAPGWVSKGVRQHYGVDQAGIKSASVRVRTTPSSGSVLSGVSINYKGRVLTLTHFNASPKTAPSARQSRPLRIPGQTVSAGSPVAMVRPPKRYSVKATIIKGQRVEMSQRSYVAGNGLPYQRRGDARLPVDVIKTVSVPQMISGKAKNTIDELIKENMEKRFQHNVEQIMK